MSAMMNSQGGSQTLLRDNMSPRSKRLAMLQQKRFEDDDEEVKGSFSNGSDQDNNQARMGGRMGSQIQSIANSGNKDGQVQ